MKSLQTMGTWTVRTRPAKRAQSEPSGRGVDVAQLVGRAGLENRYGLSVHRGSNPPSPVNTAGSMHQLGKRAAPEPVADARVPLLLNDADTTAWRVETGSLDSMIWVSSRFADPSLHSSEYRNSRERKHV